MKSAVAKMKSVKAPGWDDILPETVKVLHAVAPEVLRELYNRLFVDSCFPREWKRARVVLILKPGKKEHRVRVQEGEVCSSGCRLCFAESHRL